MFKKIAFLKKVKSRVETLDDQSYYLEAYAKYL